MRFFGSCPSKCRYANLHERISKQPLSPSGDNLPSIARHLYEKHRPVFESIKQRMQERVPGVTDITVTVTEDGRLLMRRDVQLFRLSGQQAVQVERLATLAEVEPNTDGMSQELARDLMGQMPGIARPGFR